MSINNESAESFEEGLDVRSSTFPNCTDERQASDVPHNETSPPSAKAASKPPLSKSAPKRPTLPTSIKPPFVLRKSLGQRADKKVIGLKDMNKSVYEKRRKEWIHNDEFNHSTNSSSPIHVEELEEKARANVTRNSLKLLYLGNLAVFKVFGFYLITLETIISCGLTVGLTMYWYENYGDDASWSGGALDFILLAFAVTSPLSAAIGMAFTRRERALIAIANFRSFSYHLYQAHALWDWNENGGRAAAKDVDWLQHCDAVLAQLVGIGDELCRFLSLPTASRSRHRMTKQGRTEAAQIMEVAYYLLESMTTQRMTRLTLYSERLKKIGLPSGEMSRLRQYERFISDVIEQLRMVKMYRTPLALRAFARIFTFILPPFYAPRYAEVARDVNSLGVGIAFGILTALGLTALFESLQVLEDPFTGFLALDGIDVREEFEVLHFAHLINTRSLVFPDANPYPVGRRGALTARSRRIAKPHEIGLPPAQNHHTAHDHKPSTGSISTLGHPFHEVEQTDGPVEVPMIDMDIVNAELGMHIQSDDDATVRETGFSADHDGYLSSSGVRSSPSGHLFSVRRAKLGVYK